MKSQKYLFLLLLSLVIVSCKTKENKCACNYPELDSSVICFSGSGESRDEMYSKEKALSDARTGLASLVQTRVLQVSNKFKESEVLESEQLLETRENAVRETVNQVLSKMRITCENVIETKKGTYKTYIRLEIKEVDIEQKLKENPEFSDMFIKL